MSLTRTVRLHDPSPGIRYVRVIGDGTPERTRLLDYKGEPIPEIVTAIQITIPPNGCARGTFKHVVKGDGDEVRSIESFEAFVLFERFAPDAEVARLRARVRSLEELPDRIVTLLRDGLDDVESLFRQEFGALMAPPPPDYTEDVFEVETDAPSDDPAVDETPAESVLAVPGPSVRELEALRRAEHGIIG